jgi:polyhydroxyalkanoate synthase subunit PhaC
MTKKDKEKGPDKINFEDLSTVFENNLKIYNQYVESFKNLGAGQNNFPTFPVNNQNSNNFTINDLSNLIAPTVTKMMESFKNFQTEIQQHPNIYFDNLNKWVSQIANLNFYFVTRASGGMANPVIFEEKTDKRFSNEEWKTNLFFDFIKQFYLISANFMNNLIENVEFKNPKDKRIMQFYLKQLNSALSPSNFAFTNPEVLKKTVDEKGNNLAKGYENYKKDFEKHPNKLFIQQSKAGEFEIGRNLATTKGKVIFKNNLFELIQYDCTTDQQYAKPMLVIPPFINKYYIMDLNEKKSMMKYLVDKKFNTFLISWKNPDASSRNISFKEYIEDGVLEALRVVCEKTGSNAANIASYCVGGTLASLALAYLKVVPNKYKISTATYFASLIDFEDPGELGIFITEEQITSIEQQMKKTGYFDGKDMAAAFNFLRPGDLYWNYVVNNYLLGNEPTAFDMLHWNSDSTRLPEKMHSEYLRCMYLNNLVVKNKYKIGDVEIDLSKIDTPIFSVATTEDHIAPWRSVYQGLNAYNSHVNFVLANSGHIAGIIQGTENKPGKLHFYTKKFEKGKTQDEWFNSAKKVDGSWWPIWISWLAVNSGEFKKPSELNAKNFEVLYEAPGQYVKQS